MTPQPPARSFADREIARRAVRPEGAIRAASFVDREIIRDGGRNLHKLKAKDSTGCWAYYFVFVPPSRERRFMAAIEGDGMIDLDHLGHVVTSNYGEAPSPKTRQLLKERYGFDV